MCVYAFVHVLVLFALFRRDNHLMYIIFSQTVWRHHQLLRHFEDRGNWWTFAKKREVRRWWLTFITGVFCGVVAIFVTVSTRLTTRAKYDLFHMVGTLNYTFSVTTIIIFLIVIIFITITITIMIFITIK